MAKVQSVDGNPSKTEKVKVVDMKGEDAIPVLRKMLLKAEKGGRKRRAKALELALEALGG
jgi:hypothetical protein